ncbi:hypothetical protein HZB00_03225 [Candidatus Woesearchaeota archaeon]|nr:hypothetical protein [Candidatus Woesearchaeota archaeon]
MKKGVSSQLEKKVKNLKEYIALATVPASSYQKTNIEIIKHFTEVEKIPGVYVTLNKPYETINQLLVKSKVDARLIVFIDAVTKTAGGELKKTKQCLYIGSPEKLSDISIAMDQAVRAIASQEKFVFFDSLSTLLLYNDAETVAQFIHFLAGKMRVWKIKGIIISLEKDTNEELLGKLVQVCDIVLELGG